LSAAPPTGAKASAAGETNGPAWKDADLISRVFNPLYVAIPAALAASIKVSPDLAQAFKWWAIYIVFSTIIPIIDLTVRLRLGKISDYHVTRKEERTAPMIMAIGYLSVGVILMTSLGAPRTIVAMTVTGLLLIVVTFVVTLWWKISLHAMGLFEIYALLVLVFRSWTFVIYNAYLMAILAAVCWSRLYMKKHTPAQVAAGAVVGSALPVLVFWAFGLL
jgi:membrane-associated phospholipid phosphatase